MTGSGSPCGACKFLRRKCVKGCIFAPYFSHEQGASHFAAIHKVFGASNVSKLLTHLPVSQRGEAAVTISYEAQARLHDPIYGCVSHIFHLQQQVVNLQGLLATLREQAVQTLSQGHSTASSNSAAETQFPRPEDIQNWLQSEFPTITPQNNNPSNTDSTLQYCNVERSMDLHSMRNKCAQSMQDKGDGPFRSFEGSSSDYAIVAHGFEHGEDYRWSYQDGDDLHSVAFGYYDH
ncbi:hypothetical protein Droror1_Dr00025633 [Drosera rotundifolia]